MNGSETQPQRSATRAPVDRPVRLLFDDSLEPEAGVCGNISIGGMFVLTDSGRPAGSLVRFELLLPEERTVRGLGEVVWLRSAPPGVEQSAMGIRFRFLEQRDRQMIFKLVSQHIKERLASNRPGELPSHAPPSASVAAPPPAVPVVPPGPALTTVESPKTAVPPAAQGGRRSADGDDVPVPGAASAAPVTFEQPDEPLPETTESQLSSIDSLLSTAAASSPTSTSTSSLASATRASDAAGARRRPASLDELPVDGAAARETAGPFEMERDFDLGFDTAPRGRERTATGVDASVDAMVNNMVDSMVGRRSPQDSRSEDATTKPPTVQPLPVVPPADQPAAPKGAASEAEMLLSEMPGSRATARSPQEMAFEGGDDWTDPESDPPDSYESDSFEPVDEPEEKRLPMLGILFVVLLVLGLGLFLFRDSLFSSKATPPRLDRDATEATSAVGEPDAELAPTNAPAESDEPDGVAASPTASVPTPRASVPPPRPAASPPPPAAPAGPAFTRVEDIAWVPNATGGTVRITTDGAVEQGRFRYFRLDGGSPREVIVLSGVSGPFGRPQIVASSPLIAGLRTGFHRKAGSNEVHVVVDLADPEARITAYRTVGRRLEVDIQR